MDKIACQSADHFVEEAFADGDDIQKSILFNEFESIQVADGGTDVAARIGCERREIMFALQIGGGLPHGVDVELVRRPPDVS